MVITIVGLHRGWTHGHHYGWRNHNAKVVVGQEGPPSPLRLIALDDTRRKNPAAQVGFFTFVEFCFQQFESAVGSKGHLLGQ
jgi:hypothetical protein